MKNRFFTFITMLLTVIILGTGATMLNLRLQKRNTENVEGASYLMVDRDQAAVETQSALISEDALISDEENALNEGVDVNETESGIQEHEKDLESSREPLEDVTKSVADDGKQVYYARLQDMERVYMARMNAISKESLPVQQKEVAELLEIWDDELNSIYQKLRGALSEDDFRVLRNEERAWIRNRDTAANKAAAAEKYSNSAQNLAYTRILLQWTKDRVYELAAMYYGE